jgi:hypothetical protein
MIMSKPTVDNPAYLIRNDNDSLTISVQFVLSSIDYIFFQSGISWRTRNDRIARGQPY